MSKAGLVLSANFSGDYPDGLYQQTQEKSFLEQVQDWANERYQYHLNTYPGPSITECFLEFPANDQHAYAHEYALGETLKDLSNINKDSSNLGTGASKGSTKAGTGLLNSGLPLYADAGNGTAGSSKAKDGPVEGTFVASNDAGAMTASNVGGIPDITDKLNKLMRGHEETYKYVRLLPNEVRLALFYNLVRNGGNFDLKNNPDWQHDKFIYNGEVVDKDVPGNINYGYLGKVFGFPDTLLYAAAGAAQIAADTSKSEWQNSQYWGDDPRDNYRIGQGIEIYRQRWR